LEQTILSVKMQSYPNIEHIIIDGGSTDGTVDIIKKYQDSFSFWVSEPDGGLSNAMNKGISHATGDYVMFLHSDDALIDENSIRKLMDVAARSGKPWITGFYKYVNEKNEVVFCDKLRTYSHFMMMVRNVIKHQSTIVCREAFDHIKFSPKYKYAMDYDFFLQVWENYGPPEYILDYICYFGLNGLSANAIASTSDEMTVRKAYRKEKGQSYLLLPDYFIYLAKIMKIKLDQFLGHG
jgi:glycosyltransferase involved in cell wall biosynthesis